MAAAVAEQLEPATQPNFELIAAVGQTTRIRPEQDGQPHYARQAVLEGVSLGQTNFQIERYEGLARGTAARVKRLLRKEYGAPSLTKVVDQAIQAGDIEVQTGPEPKVISSLSESDIKLFSFYARGGSNRQIVRASGLRLQDIETHHDQLLEKVGAWSRPHAVRRLYEIGLWRARG